MTHRKDNPTDIDILADLVEPLLDWYDENKRDLPWRGTRDPYRVWLSEIMLQQTRVEAVRSYYLRFIQALPDVFALANCDDDKLFKLWEGLGYYSRARNLKKAAAEVVETFGGRFPDTRDELLTLAGIGDYTAGAIASIAFERPEAAVDGNVLRVLGRVLADATPIDDLPYRKRLTKALSAVYPSGRCGDFTQSFMDLGSAVCLPGAPHCKRCPLSHLCRAYKTDTVDLYPVRKQKRPRKTERLTVLALYNEGALAVEKRGESGLLAGLWQLPNKIGYLSERQVSDWLRSCGMQASAAFTVTEAHHAFTHVEWFMRVYTVSVDRRGGTFVWANATRMKNEISLPTAFRRCLL